MQVPRVWWSSNRSSDPGENGLSLNEWQCGSLKIHMLQCFALLLSEVKLTCLQNLSVMVSAVPDCLRQIPAQEIGGYLS